MLIIESYIFIKYMNALIYKCSIKKINLILQMSRYVIIHQWYSITYNDIKYISKETSEQSHSNNFI